MGQYAGFGSPRESNQRFRALLDAGETGFSVALDLPTQMGLDSDDPRAAGEVGRVGVAIDSLADIEILMDGIPLEEISQVRTTANSIGYIWAALFVALAERRGTDPGEFGLFIQNDVLKEFIARGTQIFPPEPSLVAGRRHDRVLRARDPALDAAGDERLPHPRVRSVGRAGDRVHVRERHAPTSTSGPARVSHRPGRTDAVHVPGDHHGLPARGGEVPRRPARVGAADPRALRRRRTPLAAAADLRVHRRVVVHRAAAAEQRRPGHASRRPPQRWPACRPCTSPRTTRRSACRPSPPPRSRCARSRWSRSRPGSPRRWTPSAARTRSSTSPTSSSKDHGDARRHRAAGWCAGVHRVGLVRRAAVGRGLPARARVECGERAVVGVNQFRTPTEPLEVFAVDPAMEAGRSRPCRPSGPDATGTRSKRRLIDLRVAAERRYEHHAGDDRRRARVRDRRRDRRRAA